MLSLAQAATLSLEAQGTVVGFRKRTSVPCRMPDAPPRLPPVARRLEEGIPEDDDGWWWWAPPPPPPLRPPPPPPVDLPAATASPLFSFPGAAVAAGVVSGGERGARVVVGGAAAAQAASAGGAATELRRLRWRLLEQRRWSCGGGVGGGVQC